MDIKILGNLLWEPIDQGNLRDRHHQVIQKRIMVHLALLKSGKVELRRTIDHGKPEKTSWDMLQKVVPHREEPLLDGNAHSVKYGEMIHDGSVKPEKVNFQEGADSDIFVMGSDAAEFVNQAKRPSAKQTEKIVQRCTIERRTFNNLWNVHGCDDEYDDMHGKEFLNCSKFHHEFQRSHFETNVRHHCESGGRKKRSTIWTTSIGERIHGDNCH